MAARRSKIARLPWALRNRVCEAIADGRSGREVCDLVNDDPAFARLGLAPLSEQNVSEWRAGGQKDWEQNRAAAERLARLNEASLHLVEASGGDPAAVGSRILAGRISTMLDALGAEDSIPLAKALATLRTAEAAAARVELEKRRADHADEALALEREKFRWQAAGAALKLFEQKRAAEIAAGPGTNDEKIRALLAFMDEQEAAP